MEQIDSIHNVVPGVREVQLKSSPLAAIRRSVATELA
jgi:hypothetical protein